MPSTPDVVLFDDNSTSPSRDPCQSAHSPSLKAPSQPIVGTCVFRHPRKITAHEAVDLLGSCGASRENCECGVCFIMNSRCDAANKGHGKLTLDCIAREQTHGAGGADSLAEAGLELKGTAGCLRVGPVSVMGTIGSVGRRRFGEGFVGSDTVYWQVADARRRASGGWKSLQGRLRWEKKTFELLSSFRKDA